jgi:hypothetical protein
MKAIPRWHNSSVECAYGVDAQGMSSQLSVQMKETLCLQWQRND